MGLLDDILSGTRRKTKRKVPSKKVDPAQVFLARQQAEANRAPLVPFGYGENVGTTMVPTIPAGLPIPRAVTEAAARGVVPPITKDREGQAGLARAFAQVQAAQQAAPPLPAAAPPPAVSATPAAPGVEDYVALLGAGPQQDAYTSPYDTAAKAARGSYERAVPYLDDVYGDLGKTLSTNAAESQRNAAADFGAMEQSQQKLRESIAQIIGEGPEAKQQLALLDQGSNALTTLSREFASNRAGDARDRQSDVAMGRAGSMLSARNNLDNVLTQIEGAKAGAQQEFQKDKYAHETDVAKLKLQARAQAAEDSRTSANDEAKRQLAEIKAQEKELDSLAKVISGVATTGEQDWNEQLPEVAKRYPDHVQAFEIIKKVAKGKGTAGLVAFERMVDKATPHLRKGQFPVEGQTETNGKQKVETLSSKGLNPDRLKEWARLYYRDTKQARPDRIEQALNAREMAKKQASLLLGR